jgi:hypothetical protein
MLDYVCKLDLSAAAFDLIRDRDVLPLIRGSGQRVDCAPECGLLSAVTVFVKVKEYGREVLIVGIPTKPAMHSNMKPATCSDPKPAGVPI